MEKTNYGVVFRFLDVGWSDIGSWKSLLNSSKDENGNLLTSDHNPIISSRNCLINSNSRLTVGLDIDDLILSRLMTQF